MTLRALPHGPATEVQLERVPERRDRVAAWLVDGILVDAGGAHTAADLLRWLEGRPLDALALGHSHEDHSGGAGALAARGVPVHGGRATADRLRRPGRVPAYRAELWGQPVALRLRPAEELPLRVVPLPGHSPDQLGYLDERSGWLFSGDLALRRRQSFAMRGEDPWAMMASLRRVLALGPAALATSHRSLVLEPRPFLEDSLGYLEDLAGRIAGLHARGLPVSAMVRELFGGEPEARPGLTWRSFSGGEFSAARWVRAFLAKPDDPRRPARRPAGGHAR